MLGALAEPDERDVGAFPSRGWADVLDVDLARHDLSEADHGRGDERESLFALVRDQDS